MLPFYFALVFLSFAPWSIKLPWLARKLWRNRDPLDNYLIAGAAVVFILFTLVKTKLPHYTLPAFPLLALLLAKSLPALPTADRFVRRTALIALTVVFVAVCGSPLFAKLSPSLQLMRQARADLTSEMEFGSVEYKEPSLIWYFRRHVSGFLADLDQTSVRPFMEKPGGRFVVIPTALATSLYPTLPAGWKTYSTRGLNTANGKWLDLTLILKRS